MTLPSHNQPYWVSRSHCRGFQALEGDQEVDVVVVGAGITGLTTAILLQELGRRVAVVEMSTVGAGTTGHSTGHCDNWLDELWHVSLHKFGEHRTRLVADARTTAINVIERFDSEFGLQSDFRRIPGYLYTEDESGLNEVQNEYHSARILGLNAFEMECAPLPFKTMRALMVPDMARFSPLQYVCGLARVFAERGGALYELTRAENFKEENGACTVITNRGTISSGAIALAGHAALFGMYTIETRVYPHQSYVIAVRVEDDVPDALYWDSAQPYHYTRRASSDDPSLLIIGGADHPTGKVVHTEDCYALLEEYVQARYKVQTVEHRWSHEYFTTADALPYIGRVPEFDNIYEATGFSGDGLTFGTAAGILMADLITGKPNEWAGVFTPSRVKPFASASRFTSGVINMAWHYLGDRIAGGRYTGDELESLESLKPDEGGLYSVGHEKYAVYRDQNGEIHALSPVCAHMSCIVHWNSAEKTWDCPCHGGRYTCYGDVISGPPKHPLAQKSIEHLV